MDSLAYWTDTFWSEVADPRVKEKGYPLMSGGPIPIILIVSTYLIAIRKIGPDFMKTREAYDLKWPIRIYNISMSICNVYLFFGFAKLTKLGIDYFGCKPVDTSGRSETENTFIHYIFVYFVTKIVEFLDTVFFVLRKKYNQASNLHVFHHSFIATAVWLYLKTGPGGSTILFPLMNSGVHVIMYGYYFLATFPLISRFLWWKKYITLMQIIQFFISMVHFALSGLLACNYSFALALIGFTFNGVFAVLFIDFYQKAYRARAKVGNKSSNRADDKKQLKEKDS